MMCTFLGYSLILTIDKVLFSLCLQSEKDIEEKKDPATVLADIIKLIEEEKDEVSLEKIKEKMGDYLISNGSETDTVPSLAINEDQTDDTNESKNLFKPPQPNKKGCFGGTATPFVIVVALSIHSFFEGMALGLQKSFSGTASIFLAIAIHKCFAGMSLGISLLKTHPDNIKLCRCLILIFASSSPVGIILGMLIRDTDTLVEIIFTSLAAGTFVYIGCSEVIVKEFSQPGLRLWKLLAYSIGASIIICLFFVPSPDK